MGENLIDKIIRIKDTLPKKQRVLSNYLVLNGMNAHMMTVTQLAQRAGVGSTTLMRLVQMLGYGTYSDFRRDLFEASMIRNTSSYRGLKQSFHMSSELIEANVLSSVWWKAAHVAENFITGKNEEQLNLAVQMFIDAQRVNTIGMRLSRAAAIYFESMAGRIFPKIHQLSSATEYIFDRIYHMGNGDILLAFSVWPCTRVTVEAANLCHERGIPIVLVTNTTLNPIARYAKVVINTDSVNSGLGALPSIIVAEAMISELGRRTSPQSTEDLENLEKMLEQQKLFVYE
ncbi:MAG: MurR/RpiR family transcriptional regulator [Synergistaceae bacterium]|jgi:DNA-binding MurR/RpiR family transcriptional regulator|nr:MurR/RpiR family transcriptional regulator [Synergistaceae bacterium]